MRIVVTGNIGSGKSTAVQMLKELLPQYTFFDMDQEVHALYADPVCQEQLKALAGTTDRRELSALAFQNADLRQALETLTTSYLKDSLARALKQPRLVAEIPLFFEAGWFMSQFDCIVTVACDPAVQAQRALLRGPEQTPEIAAKIQRVRSMQGNTAVKSALADVVIDTDCDLPVLRERVAAFVQQYLGEKPTTMDALRERALADFGATSGIGTKLLTAYSQAGRHYHTQEHLAEMFALYDQLKDALNCPVAVKWAIWFHDFVFSTYLAQYPQNEIRSARAMFDMLRGWDGTFDQVEHGISSLTIAAEMICATAGHRIPDGFFPGRPAILSDLKLFLDIDLSVLSASQERVSQFDEQVFQEFAQVPRPIFRKGRIAVLEKFLERERIYFSDSFADKEAVARENLKFLIDKQRVALKGV